MLQQQQPQHYVGREAGSAPRSTLGPARDQCLIHRRHQVVIVEDLVDRPHPVVPKLVHLFREEPVGEVALGLPPLTHVRLSAVVPEPASPASKSR